MSFANVRINDGLIVYETKGGPKFSTTIITTNSGKEQRNAVWAMPRGKWELGQRLIRQAEAEAINEFHIARRGMWEGFLFKDWSDYMDAGKGILGTTGYGDGVSTSFQMVKKYVSGSRTTNRNIRKPVSGTVKVFVNGVQLTSGVSIDYTTGTVSLSPISKTITAAASSGVNTNFTTATPHGLSSGNQITLPSSMPVGYGALANQTRSVSVLSPTSFSVVFDSSAATWTGASNFSYVYQPTHLLTWTGEFDVPVRFDTDQLELTFIGASLKGFGQVDETAFELGSLPLIEIKV